MTAKVFYTKEDILTRFPEQVAKKIAYQYKRYLVEKDDVLSEINVWLYSEKGQRDIDRWLNHEPQQVSRIRYEMQDQGKKYAERMKAEKLGYDVDDIHYYNTAQVLAILPLALDESYDGSGPLDYTRQSRTDNSVRGKQDPATGGDILSMVCDVRRALARLDSWVELSVRTSAPGNSGYESAVEAIVQYLGGPKSYVGRRRVISNAEAQATTSD